MQPLLRSPSELGSNTFSFERPYSSVLQASFVTAELAEKVLAGTVTTTDTIKSEITPSAEIVASDGNICFETQDPELIRDARKLTATVYKKLNFITEDQIGEDGTIKPEFDPHVAHSRYYVVTDPEKKKVLATVRTIQHDPAKGENSFPLFDHVDELDPDYVKELREYGAENLIEVSALARDDSADDIKGTAALSLYKAIFFGANKEKPADNPEKEPVFIMACNPKIWSQFKLLFNGAIHQLGPELDYPGQTAIPAALPIADAPEVVIKESANPKNPFRGVHQRVINYFMSGYKTDVLNGRAVQALKDNGYTELLEKMENSEWTEADLSPSIALKDITREAAKGTFAKFTKKWWPEIVANAGLVAYSAARTVAVAKGVDPVAGTNWMTFAAIEFGTQFPYTWGVSDLIRGSLKQEAYPRARKYLASAAVGSAFVAPYAYLAANGAIENLQSGLVTGGILAVGLGFASGTMRKIVKKWRDHNGPATQVKPTLIKQSAPVESAGFEPDDVLVDRTIPDTKYNLLVPDSQS